MVKSNQGITAPRLKQIRINKAEFDKFRELQKKKRGDCHAAFSTNLSEIPWPFVTFGLTPERLRDELRKVSPLLDQIVGIFIEIRPTGGRFLIDDKGVYWKDDEKIEHRFVEWLHDEPLRTPIRPLTLPERLREREIMKEQEKADDQCAQ
jgi:hypothetical protein